MTISAWFTIALAIPVLLLGEFFVRHIKVLARFNIPAPVVGGLLFALILLGGNLTGWFAAKFQTNVAAPWWTWLVSTELEWTKSPSKNVNLPFLVAFFTCIGLNASWSLVKKGSGFALVFLAISAVLAVFQNVVGVLLAKMMNEPPLLGLVCGSLTLTGGVGTALGFASELEKAGMNNAAVVSVAAATFGLVAGGLVGGPLGGWLIQTHKLKSEAAAAVHLESGQTGESGIVQDFRALAGYGKKFWLHLLVLLVCIKAGAWLGYLIQSVGITFPVYMGAMILGLVVRNVADACGGRWIKPEIVDTLGSVTLGIFLAIAMMSLNLIDLANTAVPMLVILVVQIIVMGLFALFVTFPILGRSFDAAVMVAGQCGFGLGATPNAVANMKTLVERFGPSPRAFLIVPIVGGFLIDFLNALNITVFLNLFK
ncbi:MAG: sodium/glutamate symporter [Verrucomicrobiota bacterium]